MHDPDSHHHVGELTSDEPDVSVAWLHDNIEYAGAGHFAINLHGIEADSETDETIFDWLVEQAMKNEERNIP